MGAPGPTARSAETRDCPRCEGWFLDGEGITSADDGSVLLCRGCAGAEMVGCEVAASIPSTENIGREA